jgi:uncharacterized protein (TIGR03083 family)
MAKADVWPDVHAERKALVADLDGLDTDAWATRSLCEDWTVRDVVAHMTATAKMTGARFFPKLIASGFSFNKMQGKNLAAELGTSPADTLAQFKECIELSTGPPGPAETSLGEVVVHSEDIRRPLGIPHSYPPDEVVRVADFYKGSNLIIGGKNRISGLRLEANDVDWGHGDGPVVSGPMLSLVMAMTGRKTVLDDLTGEGVATLRTRT